MEPDLVRTSEGRRPWTSHPVPTLALAALRKKRPLVHNIANYVSMDVAANALLAIGASPAMVHASEEVAEFAALSDALVINIGTLSAPWVEAMRLAARAANTKPIPWVLDPVGAGATSFRNRTIAALLEERPAVIRGNASEILAVAGRPAPSPRASTAPTPRRRRRPSPTRWPSGFIARWWLPARSTSSPTARAGSGSATAIRS